MNTKIEVLIELSNPDMVLVCNVAKCMEPELTGIFEKYEISFETPSVVDDLYVQRLKETFRKQFTEKGYHVGEIVVKISK